MVFPTVGRRRCGLDPARVYGYLRKVADALAARDQALRVLDAENAQIKEALARWQSEQPSLLPQRRSPIQPSPGADVDHSDIHVRSDSWPGWNAPTRAQRSS